MIHIPTPALTPNAWLRYDVVSRLLPAEARTVLELGCGGGAFAHRLARGRDYLGVEPDGVSYTTASSRLAGIPGAEVRHGLSHDVLEPERRFDLICAFEVLEHIEDDAGAVRDWAGSLQPGGHLLVSVPAFQERFGKADVFAGHFRRYSPEQMTDLLTRCGFTDVTTVLYGMPLGYVLEHGRNVLLGRRLQASPSAPGGASDHYSPDVTQAPELMQERTAGSGRVLQPKEWMGLLTQVGTLPFRLLQRRFPGRGTGLVALARAGTRPS